MFKHAYSYGADCTAVLHCTAREARSYNRFEAAMLANPHEILETPEDKEYQRVVFQVPHDIAKRDFKSYKKVLALWNEAVNEQWAQGKEVYVLHDRLVRVR